MTLGARRHDDPDHDGRGNVALRFSRAVYDLEIVPPGNEPYRLLEGYVFLDREVTR